MQIIRRSDERGHARHGWLDSKHTFSFADFYDPNAMGFRNLRVINEDRVEPGMGFGKHPHKDMEIVTYVLEGALSHKDSMGNGSVMRPGDVQRMSAGTGVFHSEENASKSDPVHFMQIWILPRERGIAPSYEQRTFSDDEKRGKLRLVAAPDGRDGAVTVHADAAIYASVLPAGAQVVHPLPPGRHAWVHVVRGNVQINGEALSAGDAMAVADEKEVRVENSQGAADESEVLLFDLA